MILHIFNVKCMLLFKKSSPKPYFIGPCLLFNKPSLIKNLMGLKRKICKNSVSLQSCQTLLYIDYRININKKTRTSVL